MQICITVNLQLPLKDNSFKKNNFVTNSIYSLDKKKLKIIRKKTLFYQLKNTRYMHYLYGIIHMSSEESDANILKEQ